MQQYVLLTLQLSIVCIVFSLGLMSTTADLLFLWRRPGLLLRSLLAMLVVMPVVAVALTQLLDVQNTSEIALIAMAISPMPPLLPRREVKAGGLQPYAVSLLATLALLAIVTIPLTVELLAVYYRKPLTTPASAVGRLAFISVLLPLVGGIAVRAWTTVGPRLARPASQLGSVLLVIGSVLLLSATWRGIWNVIGDGTVIMVALFVAIGLVVGRVLGGPDPRQATVLGLSTACRHPAITLSIASANFPDQRFGATVILYLIVGLVLLAPYVTWSRARIAARSAAIFLVAWLGIGLEDARAQDAAKEPPKLGWSNNTDLSLVLTAGNSAAQTWGFSDKLRHVWEHARFEFEVDVVRSDTSDDRFFLIDPGLEFPVGGAPSNPGSSLVKPAPTLDVANYLTRGSYERNITPRFFWNAGASWDRSDDAGILNRYIAHAGVGNTWVDYARRRFATSYGVSYTDREEETPDPEKDRRFAGARLGWDYIERFNAGTTFDNKFAANMNLSDAADYSITTTSALTVSVVSHVSLKVSLQWLYENEPALESDLDVVAFVDVINPDGIPGSGDERFRTLSSGGAKLVVGSADARKDRLDTIFRTALVVAF